MPRTNKLLRGVALGVFSLALVSCASLSHKAQTPNEIYNQAIIDAAVASPVKVLPLRPLPTAAQASVISWVADTRIPCSGASSCNYVTGDYRIWVSLDGEVQKQCKQWHLRGDALRERLEQLLGLPPGSPLPYRKTRFVTMQVAPVNLQRACLGVNETDARHPVCTLDVQASTPTELQQFVMRQMADTYVVDSPKGPGYPFTRLGYTYDWSPEAVTKKHYGASEFLLAPKSQVNVMAITTTDDFCN